MTPNENMTSDIHSALKQTFDFDQFTSTAGGQFIRHARVIAFVVNIVLSSAVKLQRNTVKLMGYLIAVHFHRQSVT